MKKIMFVFIIGAMMGCEQKLVEEDVNPSCIEKINIDVVCTTQYDPVCGCNGKTYGNACVAAATGIKVIYNGECKK